MGGGGVRTPCTLPLDPVLVRAPSDLEGAVTFLPEEITKNYTVSEWLIFVIGIQKHLYSMKKEKRLQFSHLMGRFQF